MTEQELKKYFDFGESDLNINRSGSLSPRQKARLARSDKSTRKLFLGIGLVAVLLVILPDVALWYMGKLMSVGWYSLLWMLPCGLLAYFFVHKGLKINIYTLKKVQGEIEITKGSSGDNPAETYHELQVGGKHFGIGPELVNRMKKLCGEVYAVYYCWSTETVETELRDTYIMSLEKVSKS